MTRTRKLDLGLSLESLVIKLSVLIILSLSIFSPALEAAGLRHSEGSALVLLQAAGWNVSEVYPEDTNTAIRLKKGPLLRYGKTDAGFFGFLEKETQQGFVRADHVLSEIEVLLGTRSEVKHRGVLSVPQDEKILYAGLEPNQKKSSTILNVVLQDSTGKIWGLDYRILKDDPQGLSFEKFGGPAPIDASRFSFLRPLICKTSLK